MTIHYFTEYSPLGWFGAVHALTEEAVGYAPANSLPGTWSNASHYLDVASRTPVAMPPRPGPHHAFDRTTKQWIDPRPLQDLKDAKWAEVKAARRAAEMGRFSYNGQLLDGDMDAQRRLAAYISVSKSALASGTAFSAPFTLADNTEVTFTAQDFVNIELAKVQAVAAVFAKGVQLRAQIEAASAEELALLHW